MTRRILPLSLLLAAAAGCATQNEPYAPVREVAYSALGHDPFWMVTIGDQRIVLTLGQEGGRADGPLESYGWPRVLPRDDGEVRRWESGDGAGTIAIEARPGPCEGSAGMVFEDHVRVTLSGRELVGCGGRPLPGRRG